MSTLDRASASDARYNIVLRLLHWLMAIGFLLMFGSGIIMEYAGISSQLQFEMIQWHKSGGVLLLLAACVRLSARWLIGTPEEPAYLTEQEKTLSKLVHRGLYFMMIFIPISGWIMVSASVFGLPTIVFGLFEWPHIPGIAFNETIEGIARTVHEWIVYVFAGLIALHVAGALKHVIVDRENVLQRMGFGKTAS